MNIIDLVHSVREQFGKVQGARYLLLRSGPVGRAHPIRLVLHIPEGHAGLVFYNFRDCFHPGLHCGVSLFGVVRATRTSHGLRKYKHYADAMLGGYIHKAVEI